jgi:uncharacterized surface protein with fasciclin (FAS1) repeats
MSATRGMFRCKQKEPCIMTRKSPLLLALAAAAVTFAAPVAVTAHDRAKPNPTVGGAAMLPAKTIVENASKAPNLTTLVAAVQAAGLAETLASPGPFTVFAPTDAAFAKLPDGTVAMLVKPENKATLTKILTYHAVAGNVSSSDLVGLINKNGGSVTVTTIAGEPLKARLSGSTIVLTDAKGGQSAVTTADVRQSNGVVHVIDSVLLP